MGPALEIKRGLKPVGKAMFQFQHFIPTSVSPFAFAGAEGEPVVDLGTAFREGIGTIEIAPKILIGVSRWQEKRRGNPQRHREREAKNKRLKNHALFLSMMNFGRTKLRFRLSTRKVPSFTSAKIQSPDAPVMGATRALDSRPLAAGICCKKLLHSLHVDSHSSFGIKRHDHVAFTAPAFYFDPLGDHAPAHVAAITTQPMIGF